jgi:4-hydroxy-2-oxoheptanedioate aldolase
VRHNAIKEKAMRREPVIGAVIPFPSPELVEFCGYLGFEYAFIDAEHGPIGALECQTLVRACEATGMSSIVRVPQLDRELIMTFLQTGVQGIAAPHITTAQEAQALVEAARYYPEGRRGCDVGARASGYNLLEPPSDYFARANREILVAAWIEDVTGLQNLDEILAVPGIDAFCFGFCDLALSLGLPGRHDHPTVRAALEMGWGKVLSAGKLLIGEPASLEAAQEMLARGACLLSTQVLPMLAAEARSYLAGLRFAPHGTACTCGETR